MEEKNYTQNQISRCTTNYDECGSSKYLLYEERMKSFNKIDPQCPNHTIIYLQSKAPRFAESGFYYTGEMDKVHCVYCQTFFLNWDLSDDPIVEHAYFNPECEHIQYLVGELTMNKIANIKTICHVSHSMRKKMIYDLMMPKDYIKCVQCWDRPIGVCFLPCRHVKYCTTCGLSMKACLACRTEIETFVPIKF